MKTNPAAIYLRLSTQDGDVGEGKDESDSIENQRSLLMSYLLSHPGLCDSVIEYVDDGYSGASFDRPAFKRMLDDAQKSRFKTLLVKDFSRLGRDYIGVGDYVEQVFPSFGIRLIAVNNRFDSDTSVSSSMSLGLAVENLANSFYAKDISVKRRSANRILWKRGYATASRVPFGYYWDCRRKGEWNLDPVASGCVRRVFDLALEGKKPSDIARVLNSEDVPTPGVYAALRMEARTKDEMSLRWTTNRARAPREQQHWDTDKVTCILRRGEYTGALIMDKHQRLKADGFGKSSVRLLPESEQVVVEGAHEAIITSEEFRLAQGVIRSRSARKTSVPKDYPLRGSVRCGRCGRALSYRVISRGAVFACKHCGASGSKKSSVCTEAKVNASVLQAIYDMAEKARVLEVNLNRKGISEEESSRRRNELDARVAEIEEKGIHLYEDYANGLTPRGEYLSLKAGLEGERTKLENEHAEVKSFLSLLESLRSIRTTFSRLCPSSDIDPGGFELESRGLARDGESLANLDVSSIDGGSGKLKEGAGKHSGQSVSLTKELVDAFVEVVYIHAPTRIDVHLRPDPLLASIEEILGQCGGL